MYTVPSAYIACTRPGEEHSPVFMICRSCDAVAEAGAKPDQDTIYSLSYFACPQFFDGESTRSNVIDMRCLQLLCSVCTTDRAGTTAI